MFRARLSFFYTMAGTEIDDIFRGKTPKVRNVQKGKEGEKESRAEKGKVGEGVATAQKGKEKREAKQASEKSQTKRGRRAVSGQSRKQT